MKVCIREIVICWFALYTSFVNADAMPVQTQMRLNQSCSSISGRYFFKGKDESSGELRSFFQVLWWGMAPTLWGDPTEIELVHDASQNTMQIKMYGRGNLRSEPRADDLFSLSCVDGSVSFDGGSHESYSDGHHHKYHYSFQFVRSEKGVLTVNATYDTEDERLFFISDRNRVKQTTKFLPANSEEEIGSERK